MICGKEASDSHHSRRLRGGGLRRSSGSGQRRTHLGSARNGPPDLLGELAAVRAVRRHEQLLPRPQPGFENGTTGWTLTGGAHVIADNEPWNVGGSGDSRSRCPAGSSATSPATCINLLSPHIRLFATAGRPTATCAWTWCSGASPGTCSASSTTRRSAPAEYQGWRPSENVPSLLGLPALTSSVQLKFTPVTTAARGRSTMSTSIRCACLSLFRPDGPSRAILAALFPRQTVTACRSRAASTSEARIGVPPVAPSSGSTACSGCGIRPKTLPSALMTPATSATEPFGLSPS